MSTAALIHAELSKSTHLMHIDIHAAFGFNQKFPHGKVLYQEAQFGMLVQAAIEYPDESTLVYLRDPGEDQGEYFYEALN